MTHFMIGKTILDVKIAADKKALLFKCIDGDHVARADGDCCSTSWVEAISLPALGLPATVTSAEDKTIEEIDSDYDLIKVYGLELTTNKGALNIDYRNASNWYYGGNLSFPDDEWFYGGVFEQNVSTENWVDITEDDQ